MFMTITGLFIASVSTPYNIKGVAITFGDEGLWNVDFNSNSTQPDGGDKTHYRTTQVLLIISAVAVGFALLGYILMFRSVSTLSMAVTFLSQATAGILALSAVGAFANSDPSGGEGWWLACTSGIMYLLSSIVIIVMPFLDSEQYKLPDRVVYV